MNRSENYYACHLHIRSRQMHLIRKQNLESGRGKGTIELDVTSGPSSHTKLQIVTSWNRAGIRKSLVEFPSILNVITLYDCDNCDASNVQIAKTIVDRNNKYEL